MRCVATRRPFGKRGDFSGHYVALEVTRLCFRTKSCTADKTIGQRLEAFVVGHQVGKPVRQRRAAFR